MTRPLDRAALLAKVPRETFDPRDWPDPRYVGEEEPRPEYDWRPHLTRLRPRFHARHVILAAFLAFLAGVLARSVWPG